MLAFSAVWVYAIRKRIRSYARLEIRKMAYSGSSKLFASTTLTETQFRTILSKRSSPALSSASAIYRALRARGFDPEIFLAQFAAESSYGRLGWCRIGNLRNPGNILFYAWTRDGFRAIAWKPRPDYRYTYSKFPSWDLGTRAYVALMSTYRSRGFDTLWEMSARWLGATPGTTRHTNYLGNILFALRANRALLPSADRVYWGSDIVPSLRIVDRSGTRTANAMRKVGHNFGTVINVSDLNAAFRRAGMGFGTVVDSRDLTRFLSRFGV